MLLETHQNEKEHSMGMICQDRMGSAEIINSIISMAFLLIKKNNPIPVGPRSCNRNSGSSLLPSCKPLS